MATVLTSSSDDLPESQRPNGAVEDVSQGWNFCSCFVFLLKKGREQTRHHWKIWNKCKQPLTFTVVKAIKAKYLAVVFDEWCWDSSKCGLAVCGSFVRSPVLLRTCFFPVERNWEQSGSFIEWVWYSTSGFCCGILASRCYWVTCFCVMVLQEGLAVSYLFRVVLYGCWHRCGGVGGCGSIYWREG